MSNFKILPKGEGCLRALGNHCAFVKELAALVVVFGLTALKHDEDAWQTVGVNSVSFAGRNCDIENTNCVILAKDPVVGRSSSIRALQNTAMSVVPVFISA